MVQSRDLRPCLGIETVSRRLLPRMARIDMDSILSFSGMPAKIMKRYYCLISS